MEWASASTKIDQFLRMFVEASAMQLTYELTQGSGEARPQLGVAFSGPEARFLVARNAELLHALETLATEILRLAPEEHDLISFDAEGYKARRVEQMERAATVAISTVTSTGRPYAFAPMNSRERRMLHLQLANSGLRSASSGEASRRYVVLYPTDERRSESAAGGDRPKVDAGRLGTIRSAFRPR